MALQYEYLDTYIVNSLDISEIENAETKALTDLANQEVTDVFYLEEMCKCLVYVELGARQLEAENMSDRVAHYRKEYNRYNTMDLHGNTDEGIYSATLERG